MRKTKVSFVMAAYNAAATIDAAIASALAQTGVDVEVIAVDNNSVDDTSARITRFSERDPRVVLCRETRKGPSPARNRGIDAATGDWIAVLDADDLIAPNRSEVLVGLAEATASTLVADNVARFLDQEPDVTWALLPEGQREPTFVVDVAAYLRSNLMTGGDTNLGYLKPMFQRRFLRDHDIRYDDRLRIGEDCNICLQALIAGAKYTITAVPYYRYRVVQNSLSRGLDIRDLEMLLTVHRELMTRASATVGVATADRAYQKAIADVAKFMTFRRAVRDRRFAGAGKYLADPRLWLTALSVARTSVRRRRNERAVRTKTKISSA